MSVCRYVFVCVHARALMLVFLVVCDLETSKRGGLHRILAVAPQKKKICFPKLQALIEDTDPSGTLPFL